MTGGEPTIHADLPDFLHELKQMGYSVKLDTNGSHPQMLSQVINQELVDFVAMDIKTVLKTDAYANIIGIDNAELLEKVKQSISILRQGLVTYEFRTTKIPNVHSPNIIERIKARLNENERLTINEYRDGNTISAIVF